MRILAYELKKLWNWRVIALIAVLGTLMWFALLSESLRSYDSLTTHGIYGSYQNEMFALYGDTLEPDELANYNIPGKKAALIAEIDEIIATESIFTESNIHSYAEYDGFINNSDTSELSDEEREAFSETMLAMQSTLYASHSEQTLDEWYTSPLMKLQTLNSLEHMYINYEPILRSYINLDTRPVVVEAAEKLLQMGNTNLIRYDLIREFSLYTAVVGVFTVISAIILIAPLLTTDRMRKLNLMQYSSTIGRKILMLQFAATMISTFVLSVLLIIAAYIPFLAAGAGDYWDAHIMSFSSWSLQLYNITFGQYVLILAGMILALSVGAACFAFILARFSANIVMMLIKSVPVGVAIAGIAGIAMNMALSGDNIIFTTIFRGRLDAPEVVLCGVIAVIGLIAAVIIAIREKRVDVV